MARIESWYKQDLKKPVPVRKIETVFNQDALGHLFGVEVYSDGEAVTLAGSVTGYCLLADGTTVPVSGTRTANKAYIVIPQTAYSVIGPITITVKLTEGTAITTLLAVVGMVARSRTGQQVNPGSTVTDWTNQISAQLQAVQTAADNVGAIVAAPFDTTVAYEIGNYVTYNGNLYRFATDHAAGDWDASEVSQVTVGQEITDLKSALNEFDNYYDRNPSGNLLNIGEISLNSGLLSASGKQVSADGYFVTDFIPVALQYLRSTVRIFKVVYYDSNKGYLSVVQGNAFAYEGKSSADISYIRCMIANEYLANIANVIIYEQAANNAATTQRNGNRIPRLIDFDKVFNDRFDEIKPSYIDDAFADVIFQNGYIYDNSLFGFELGSIASVNGENLDSNTAIRFHHPIKLFKGTRIAIDVSGNVRLFKYSEQFEYSGTYSDGTEQTVGDTGFYRLAIYSISESFSTPDDLLSKIKFSIEKLVNNEDLVRFPILRDGTTYNAANTSGVAMKDIFPTYDAESITFIFHGFDSQSVKHRFQWTTYNKDNGITRGITASAIKLQVNYETITNHFTITKAELGEAKGIAVGLFQKDDSDQFIPMRVENLDYENPLIVIYNYSDEKYDNYNINRGFAKTPIRLTEIGTISGYQSFCKYDGRYYSADGAGKVYVQSGDFADEQNVDLAVGHANSFQLGSTKYAYISGWNDNTIYVIDLDSLVISETISLPTTGYTTAAIDDLNKIAYIFQRDTRPSTLEHYNFIVYDYDNQQIIRQRKTSASFGAMQACDFCDDRIIVLNGLGTTENPCGYRVYDTFGNIVSEYVIGEQSGSEPEGAFIDRKTKQILISYVNGRVYKLTEIQ